MPYVVFRKCVSGSLYIMQICVMSCVVAVNYVVC